MNEMLNIADCFTALNKKSRGAFTYTEKVKVNADESNQNADEENSQAGGATGSSESSGKSEPEYEIITKISSVGKDYVNIETTIDSWNYVPWQYVDTEWISHHFVLHDYVVPECFRFRLQPAIVGLYAEDMANRSTTVRNYLVSDSGDIEGFKPHFEVLGYKGRILDIYEFKDACLNVFKALNPKVSSLGKCFNPDRQQVVLTRDMVRNYPTLLKGKYCSIDSAEIMKPYAIHPLGAFDDNAYVRRYEDRDFKDLRIKYVQLILDHANSFEARKVRDDKGNEM